MNKNRKFRYTTQGIRRQIRKRPSQTPQLESRECVGSHRVTRVRVRPLDFRQELGYIT